MASILTGSIVAEIRGSVGTEAYSRNAFGPYVKTRKSPTNPNTVPQQNARAVITAAVLAWQGLTDAQRNLYNVEARSRNSKNRLGQVTRLTGYHLFIRQRSIADISSLSPVSAVEPPALNGIYQLDAINPASASFTIDSINPSLISGARMTVYASNGRSAGQMSFNPSTLRVISNITTANGPVNVDIKSAYETVFGLLSGKVGNRVTIGFNTSRLDSAELSKTLYLSALVAA